MRWIYARLDGASAPGAVFWGAPKKPASAPAPAPMPDLQDPALLAKRKNLVDAAASRSGRLSTLLTEDGGYSGDKLGLR